MKRFFRNIPWKNVLIIALVAVLGVGAVAGVAAIAKNDSKTISSTVFKRGAIDQNGFYVESENSLYTKDLIECQGLEIAPDFEATGTYQVFFYDAKKAFIGSTQVFDCSIDGVYIRGEEFAFAKYCRIMITPETPKDDYGNTIEDYKIKFYEVAGIANKFTISVNKSQGANNGYSDYEIIGKNVAFHHAGLNQVGMEYTGPQPYDGYDLIHIDVEGKEKVVLQQYKCESLAYRIVDGEGMVIYAGAYPAEKNVEISLPENSVDIYISINQVSGNYLIHAE